MPQAKKLPTISTVTNIASNMMKVQYQERPLSSQATTAAILYKNMPKEIMSRIYGRNRNYAYKVKAEIEWNDLIFKYIKYNLANSYRVRPNQVNLFSEIYKKYVKSMLNIKPILTELGFEPNSFDLATDNQMNKPMWWFEDSRMNEQTINRLLSNRETGLQWKTTIWVCLKINKEDPKIKKMAEPYRIKSKYNNLQYLSAVLYKNNNCIIQTTENWNKIIIQFTGIMLPLDDYFSGSDTESEDDMDSSDECDDDGVFYMDWSYSW